MFSLMNTLNVIYPFLLEAGSNNKGWLEAAFDNLIDMILYNLIYKLFYYVECALCKVISWMQELFDAFSGITKITYNGQSEYIISIFFGNSVIKAVYMGMEAIGLVLIVLFAIIAVVRKSFDIDDQVKRSHGQILRSMMRGSLVIICMNLVIIISIEFTNVLMESVVTVFNKAPGWAEGPSTIVYTDEQFATMGRILNTIGNYSVNPSYKSRYNVNACYNEIRGDLEQLNKGKVFNYYYTNVDENGNIDNTWQYALREIAKAADFTKEQPVDVYNEQISNSIINCMEMLKTDANFHALERFSKPEKRIDENVQMDRVLFLMGTMGMGNTAAAKNSMYNSSPGFADDLRYPYYVGKKSIYDLEEVSADFNISIMKTNYLTVYAGACILIYNMALIIVNCVVRIFNLLFLYIAAPPIIATSPLDGGEKYKQWVSSFVAQLFSVFATVISMRLFLVFIPIIMSPEFKLTDSTVIDIIGKLVMLWAGTKAVNKSVALLDNILGVGREADMSHELRRSAVGHAVGHVKGSFEGSTAGAALGKVTGMAAGAVSLPGKAMGAVARGAASPLRGAAALGKAAFNKAIGNPARNAMARMSGSLDGWSNKTWIDSPEQKQQQSQQQRQQQQQQQFQARVLQALNHTSDGRGKSSGNSPKENYHSVNDGKADEDDLEIERGKMRNLGNHKEE